MEENYDITFACGHYEVYIDGKFYCSTDSAQEAVKEVEEYEKEHATVC